MAVDGGGRTGGEERRAAPRGYVPVLVGAAAAEEEGGLQRFLVSVEAFKHARFVSLLGLGSSDTSRGECSGSLVIPSTSEERSRCRSKTESVSKPAE
ncbi:unnamed protein product [Musa textilis]